MTLSFRNPLVTASLLTAALTLGLSTVSRAQTPPATAPAPAQPAPMEPADVAAPKRDKDGKINARFQQMHDSFLKRGKSGKIGVLFVGDSITEGWSSKAKDIWEAHYGKYDAANFGISGDKTEHVLWRIDNGELDGIDPKVVVLMIGTNNIGYPADDIARADIKIVSEIHQKLPNAKILILGIFPRGADASDPKVAVMRSKISSVNIQLAKLADRNQIFFLDFGRKFLDDQYNLPKDIMPDALHPNHQGYEIWADAMQPQLDTCLSL